MIATTLCFLLKDGEVLLGMKKRGFGIGKWNGIGGKVKKGESIADAAIREVEEEIGIMIAPEDLNCRGGIFFEFENHSSWNQHCTVFVAEKWGGNPSESDEMIPAWYPFDQVPFHNMWVDDPHWVPRVLAGKKIKAKFLFDRKGNGLVKYDVIDDVK